MKTAPIPTRPATKHGAAQAQRQIEECIIRAHREAAPFRRGAANGFEAQAREDE
ncbi:hypothetical protein [Sphingomonas sp. PP-CC-3G-468]|uniref:hypothetical protein n=1 Tax=Sphingomonas sp. PP-CC-3G-468 TaxID=2135656 RepID=UPI001FB1B53A|nr:hypothetical protein [Sphingomonas sp. PP-CC-3G-468]